MSAARSRGYAFGDFRLYPEEGLLLRSGQPVPLPPKTFKMLCVLVEHRGHLVSKESLIQEVWPDTFVVESNLRYNLSLLRKALSANGDAQEFIVTSPKFGYRFVADVREVEDEAEQIPHTNGPSREGEKTHAGSSAGELAPATQDSTPPVPKEKPPVIPETWSLPRWRPIWAIGIAFLLVAVATLAIVNWVRSKSRRPETQSATSPHTLAVLPLRNLKPDPETDFLGLALTDSIISRLAYVDDLIVLPTSSVLKYRNTTLDAQQVARELKVSTVLSGSYVKDGEDIRITTELIPAGNAAPLRQTIDLKYEKLISVQDRVAESVIHSLGLSIQPRELEETRRGLPSDPLAYEYYLRANDLSYKSNYEGAVELLEKSVALAPRNAMAWATLGNNYLGYARVQSGGEAYARKGWDAFKSARTLDPENPFIRSMVAFQLIENNRLDEATVLLREQLRQHSNDSWAHWYLSEAYRYGGALDESVKEGELARKLNPTIPENTTLNTYLYVGRYDTFLASLPEDGSARTTFYRGLAYYYLNDKPRAFAEFDQAYALAPTLLHAQIGEALESSAMGRNAAGLELMRKIEKAETEDGEMTYKMAQAYAQLGDRESSLRLLRKSIDLNFYPYSYFVSDPLFAPLQADSHFGPIIELARERQEAFRRKYF